MGSTGMTDDLKNIVVKYIHACRRVGAGELSVLDEEFSTACEDVAAEFHCWTGFNDRGWMGEERALCMLMLEEQARVHSNPDNWVNLFFVTADPGLFATATRAFGGQFDMLGQMLESADGEEELETIVHLCARLGIQPFRRQDIQKHLDDEVLDRLIGNFDDVGEQDLVRAWYDAKCRGAGADVASTDAGVAAADAAL